MMMMKMMISAAIKILSGPVAEIFFLGVQLRLGTLS
jgi:hypothetical protein